VFLIFVWRLTYHFLCFLKLLGLRGGTSQYFAYGGNLDPAILERRNIRPLQTSEFTLKDYALAFNHEIPFKDAAMASIQKTPNQNVTGLLYEIYQIDVLRLDCMEAHLFFNRYGKTFELTTEGSKFFFYTTNTPREGLKPTRNYLDRILTGYSQLKSVDPTFLENLKNTPTVPGFFPKDPPNFLIKNYLYFGKPLRPILVWYDKFCVSLFAALISKPSFLEKFC
jgi:hypothetical protein